MTIWFCLSRYDWPIITSSVGSIRHNDLTIFFTVYDHVGATQLQCCKADLQTRHTFPIYCLLTFRRKSCNYPQTCTSTVDLKYNCNLLYFLSDNKLKTILWFQTGCGFQLNYIFISHFTFQEPSFTDTNSIYARKKYSCEKMPVTTQIKSTLII